MDVLLSEIAPRSPFYREKFAGHSLDHADFTRLPLTTKAELVHEQDHHPPYGRFLTEPLENYVRLHQTSGTKGQPLRWLDTRQSWDWMLDNWDRMFSLAGLEKTDRLFFPFSFGPFLGFWTAFEAAGRRGLLSLAAGGMSTPARLKMLVDNQASFVLTTPTYALHLAEVAREQKLPLAVRALILAGEPGGSIPATRRRIEEGWNARVFDHHGMTEVGPMTIECFEAPGGLHLVDDAYHAEVLDPATLEPVAPGQVGELIVTNLGRLGSPLIRYRTGDLVRIDPKPCQCRSNWIRFEGGILGRTDDMIPIRGNNFYPSALEGVLRRFDEVAEYRVEIDTRSSLAELRIEIEPIREARPDLSDRIAQAIRDDLLFRAEVKLCQIGSLPRFEMKAQRIHRK